MEKLVTFIWDNGFTKTFNISNSIHCIKHNSERPSIASFSFDDKTELTKIELENIHKCIIPALHPLKAQVIYKESK